MEQGKGGKKQLFRKCLAVLFLFYIVLLMYLLFFAEQYGRVPNGERAFRYNLIPFREICRFIRARKLLGMRVVLLNLLGNVAAFIPFGFFLPILSAGMRRMHRTAVSGFLLSLLVETVQLVSKTGAFDVDDIFLNTLGVVMGFTIFAAAGKKGSRIWQMKNDIIF
ncbi:MAG: VanZ family protein [Lachnospiraceae bacterium]|nr:VanZ family protein [Lachnospiraceae bacterium]